MRKLFLLVLLLTAWIAVGAAPVPRDKARQSVADFVGQNASLARSMKGGQSALSFSLAAEGRHYYIFNINGGNGFVVAAGDDRIPAILGYTLNDTFNAENAPQNMLAWLQGVADQVDYADKHHIPLLSAPRRTEDHASVAPLLKSQWDQGSPYNGKCPMDNETGQRSVTGCAATAMAQVINYYHYPEQTIGTIPGYTTTSRGIAMPGIAPTAIDWDNMRDSYLGNTTNAQKQAIAQLMLLCGCAINMDYTSSFSGASEVFIPEALIKYFGYDQSARRVARNDLRNNEWDELIYGELAAGRPVIYCGQSTGGGHAFVVDGYGSDGYYHVNWGWSGQGDNFYLLSILNPYGSQGIGGSNSSDGFSYFQAAVVGMKPDAGGKPEGVRMSTYAMKVIGNKTIERSPDGYFHASLRASMYNLTGNQHDFHVGAGVFGANEEVLEPVIIASATLGSGWGWDLDQYPFDIPDFRFGHDLPDGKYKIKMISGEAGSNDYDANYGSNKYYIPATIQGNTLTLANPEIKLTGTMQLAGEATAGETVNMKVFVTNEGTDFCDDVFMFVGSTFLGGRTMEVDAGQTIEFDFDFIKDKGGDYPVGLYYYENNIMNPIAETTISVGYNGKTHLSYSFQITNAQENNVLTESTVRGKVNLTNDGTLDYNDRVAVLLYKYSPDSNIFQYIIHKEQNIALQVGAATQIDFEFNNLENDSQYLLALQYVKEDEWVDDKVYFQFNVALEQPPLPENQLDIIVTVEDLDEQGKLHQDAVSGSIAVTNTGTIAYNDSIWTVLYREENSQWVAQKVYDAILQLGEGKSTTLNFAFEGLEDGGYAVALLYKKNGNEYQYGMKTFTVVLPPTPVPDNELTVGFIIDGLDEQGHIHQNAVQGSIVLTNTGTIDYNGSIWTTLYRQENSQWVPQQITDGVLQLGVSESTTLNYTFEDLEEGYYAIALQYVKNENEKVERMQTFTVTLPPPPVPDNHLAVSFSIENAGEKGMLLTNQVKGTILAFNDGETAYQDSIAIALYEMVEGQNPVMVQGSWQQQLASIQQGETLSLPFEYSGLEPYKEYVVAFAYRKNAEELVNNQSISFYFDEEASGIASTIGSSTMPVIVFALDGRKMGTSSRSELPQLLNRMRKGIYVINGKKVRNQSRF